MPTALYLDAPFMRDGFYETHSALGTSLITRAGSQGEAATECTAKDGVLRTGLEL